MTREKIEGAKEVVIPYVMEELRHYNVEGNGEADAEEARKDLEEIFGLAIKALEQEPKTGRWIESDAVLVMGYSETDNFLRIPAKECSVCHKPHIRAYRMNYCPNCGAKMAEIEG